MLFDLFLLLITVSAILLCLKYKAELEKSKERSAPVENRVNAPQSEEFTLALSKLTGEFSGQITLDSLTGLPGREAFEDRLQQTLYQSERFEKSLALIVMNINQFHHINDTEGYDVGDKLLRAISKRLQEIIRQIDTVTRYAGDTFVFLLPQLTLPETAVYVAQRILDNMVLPFKIDEREILLSANVGVAIYPLDGQDAIMLLQNANKALLQAKEQGKDKYQFYHQELHVLSQRELAIHTCVCSPGLLEQLSIQYQPHVNVNTNEVVCVQAVSVMTLPDHGRITFTEFFKIAENCKKIVEIGEWSLQTAIIQFKKWHLEGFKPKQLAVNVTLSQVNSHQFIYNAAQLLQKHQIKSSQLIFEIIDENIFADVECLEKSFSLLNHYGIQMAFSFLTMGHFAVQKIAHFPVNYLKIDSKLIQDDERRQKNEPIIRMLVILAKDMKIHIVAEGVNDEKQKQLWQALDCDVMQGKLFGEVLPLLK